MNRGKSWETEEELQLLREIQQRPTLSLEVVAQQHGRSVKAIQLRLASLFRKEVQQLSGEEGISSARLLSKKYGLPEHQICSLLAMQATETLPPRPSPSPSAMTHSEWEDLMGRLDRIERLVKKLYKRQYPSKTQK